MSSRNVLMIVAAASLTSAVLILPTSGLAAHGWTTVINRDYPMVEGSGRIVQQSRAVGNFDRIETWGAEQVEVRVGPRPSLVIAADDNILPLLTSEVRDGTLRIKSRGSYRLRGPIRMWITVPSLNGVGTWGSGNVNVAGVNSARFALTSYGSGDVTATGRTGDLNVDIYGSGTARLQNLAARDVDADIFGSGEALVRADGNLSASIMGSGDVRYVGRPASVQQSRFGSGRVRAYSDAR